MREDGTFEQAEITSWGLNQGPLPANNTYRATIACCLVGPDATQKLPLKPLPDGESTLPYHTGMKDEQATDGYGTWIENLLPGAVFGYKYLDFSPHCTQLTMRLRGKGILTMRLDHPAGEEVARISVDSEAWTDCKANFTPVSGVHALYFTVESGVRIACQHFCFS